MLLLDLVVGAGGGDELAQHFLFLAWLGAVEQACGELGDDGEEGGAVDFWGLLSHGVEQGAGLVFVGDGEQVHGAGEIASVNPGWDGHVG